MDLKTPDLHDWDDRHAKQEGGGGQSSDPDSSDWALDVDDDEPVKDPSDDTDTAAPAQQDLPPPMVQPGAVEDHMVEAVNAIDDADQEPQNAAFAAAIRWALRARNLDLNGGNAGIGGGAEEIDEADDGIGLNLIGDRVDQNMDRARELIAEADRRIRQAEGHARLGPEGVFMGVRMGANSGRGNIDRRTRRREKIISKEKLQGDRQCTRYERFTSRWNLQDPGSYSRTTSVRSVYLVHFIRIHLSHSTWASSLSSNSSDPP